MKTYADALASIREAGRWELLKWKCFSAYITFEAYCLPARSKARAKRLTDEQFWNAVREANRD